MKNLCIALLLCIISTTAFAAGSSDGFVSLFNGKNLDGWVVGGNAEGFKVVEGCIHSDGGKGGDWIHTDKQYGNFVFRLEWMLSKTGNSGILIRHGVPSPGLIEAQLLAPWTPYRDDLHCTGSIYGHVEAKPRPDETTLRWRKAEVRAEYKTISVYIDGVKTSEGNYDKIPSMKGLPLVGFLGMQDSHTEAGEWVKFRNIEIKDLDQDPAFVVSGMVSEDLEINRVAYDAAVRLGTPMVSPLLDVVRDYDGVQLYRAKRALSRITLQAVGPQASDIKKMLTERVKNSKDKQTKDCTYAIKLLETMGVGVKS